MAIPLYLAQTAAEFAAVQEQPTFLAWMACHFSPYGTGLTNLPGKLPENSLLILNDRTPVHGHDPDRIKVALEEMIVEQNCCGLLLDFQRPNCPETTKIVRTLLSLPCPVCVSDLYAENYDCPVFVPPVPLLIPMEQHLQSWKGREIWLEAATGCANYTVKESGCDSALHTSEGIFPHWDEELHCHYGTKVQDDSVLFSVNRTKDDLLLLLEDAASLGVTRSVGLWQELK